MTEAESIEALKRIQSIERFAQEPGAASFGGSQREGWDEASRRLARAIEEAAERLQAFIRVENPAVGIVSTDWTGDVRCVWNRASGAAERERHLLRFVRDFEFRIRLGQTLAAAVRAAVTISRAAAVPLTALSAIRAAWELVKELEKLRTTAT